MSKFDRNICTSIYFITHFYHIVYTSHISIILCTQLRRAVYYGPYIELLDILANLDHFKCIRDPKKFDSGEYELDPQEVPLSRTHSLRLSRAHLFRLVCFFQKIRLFSYSFPKKSDSHFFSPQKSGSDFFPRKIRLGFFLACTSFSIHICVFLIYVYFFSLLSRVRDTQSPI